MRGAASGRDGSGAVQSGPGGTRNSGGLRLAIAFVRRLLAFEGQHNLLKARYGRVRQDVDVDIVRAESLFVLAEADPDPLWP